MSSWMRRHRNWKCSLRSTFIWKRIGRYLPLRDVSPVVRTLAQEQFDRYVKRVRLFLHPRLRDAARGLPIVDLLQQAIDTLG